MDKARVVLDFLVILINLFRFGAKGVLMDTLFFGTSYVIPSFFVNMYLIRIPFFDGSAASSINRERVQVSVWISKRVSIFYPLLKPAA